MTHQKVRLGLVPSWRKVGPVTNWVIKMREEAIQTLSQFQDIELIFPSPLPEEEPPLKASQRLTPHGCVCNLNEAEQLTAYFKQEEVDGIIIAALNFGDERSAVKVAERLGVPVLLYATKEPPVPQGPSLARVSDSYCGTLSIAAGLHRRGLPFHYAGIFLHQEPDFASAIQTYARAVSVVRAFKNARLGQIGVRPPNFESVAFDELALARKFGQNVIYAEVSQIVDRARQLDDTDPRILDIISDMRNRVAKITVAEDWLLKAAKLECAITDFCQEEGLSAISAQCWPTINTLWQMSVCAVFGRLTEKGLLMACESDTLGALSMLANHAASLGSAIPHFVDWTIQHRENPNKLLAWHCGNAPLCLARFPNQTALRSRQDMMGVNEAFEGDPFAGLYQFQVKPGAVTFCRIAELDGHWKMLIATGEAVPSDETLAGTWSWVAVPNHDRLYRTLVENGFIHHASMVHENQIDVLTMACKYLDIETVIVR
jgi:L-fucose isomerase-like protein